MSIQLTEADLRRLFPRARQDYVSAIMLGVPTLQKHGILDNSERWCAFIANVGCETGGLTVVRENMAYTASNLLSVWPSRYPDTVAGRAKARSHAAKGARYVANYNYGFRLGNRGRHTDDGWNFRGALLLQHTGRDMAVWLQEKTGKPWADDPSLFDNVMLCVEPACLVWTSQKIGDLNLWADRGQFRACCNGINRGNPKSAYNPIGWDHRQEWHRKALAIWGDGALPKIPKDPSVLRYGSRGKIVEHYQQRLHDLGYQQVGLIDGKFGDNTETAVRQFQRINNLTVDGIIGPQTRAALDSEDALPRPISEDRENATVADVAAAVPDVRRAQAGKGVAKVLSGIGVLGLLGKIAEQVQAIRNIFEPLLLNVTWLLEYWPIAVLAAGLLLWHFFSDDIGKWVADFREGRITS